MKAERKVSTAVAGFRCEVQHASVQPGFSASDNEGVGTSVVMSDRGELLLAFTIVHADGTLLTAFLDEDRVDQLAHGMADFIEAIPPLASRELH